MGWQVIAQVIAQQIIAQGANAGVFVYSGTPGPGNPPIFWAASGTKDPFGNTLPSTAGFSGDGVFEGLVTANSVPYITRFGLVKANTPGIGINEQNSAAFVPAFFGVNRVNSSGTQAFVSSGRGTSPAQEAVIQLLDSLNSVINNGQILLQAGNVAIGSASDFQVDDNTKVFFLPAGGTPQTPSSGCGLSVVTSTGALAVINPSGVTRQVSQAQVASTGNTVTQATYTAVGDGFVIHAAEVVAGTAFRITTFGHGTFGSTTQNLFMAMQGTNAEAEMPSTAQTASGSCIWRTVCELVFTSATVANIHTQMTVSGFPGSNGWAANGNSTGVTITFPFTVRIFAHWASTTGAPTVTGDSTIFERLAN